jgi:hypothetical protein
MASLSRTCNRASAITTIATKNGAAIAAGTRAGNDSTVPARTTTTTTTLIIWRYGYGNRVAAFAAVATKKSRGVVDVQSTGAVAVKATTTATVTVV